MSLVVGITYTQLVSRSTNYRWIGKLVGTGVEASERSWEQWVSSRYSALQKAGSPGADKYYVRGKLYLSHLINLFQESNCLHYVVCHNSLLEKKENKPNIPRVWLMICCKTRTHSNLYQGELATRQRYWMYKYCKPRHVNKNQLFFNDVTWCLYCVLNSICNKLFAL